MLILIPAASVHELFGFSQAAERSAALAGAWWIAPVLAGVVLLSAVGQFGGIGTAISRLPLVVGVDHLLPRAFASVHPRWHTPHISILVLGLVASTLLFAMQIGDTLRVAYQELVSLMTIAGFLPYVYMFRSSWKAGNALSAVSGLAVTLLAMAASVVPTHDVTNVWLFEGKLIGGTAALVISARLVYRRASSRIPTR
jgi:APA family basic amino acid/polyamine antiporter